MTRTARNRFSLPLAAPFDWAADDAQAHGSSANCKERALKYRYLMIGAAVMLCGIAATQAADFKIGFVDVERIRRGMRGINYFFTDLVLYGTDQSAGISQ